MKSPGLETQAGKKLISYILKRDPKLTDRELGLLMNNIRRFVTVVQKIYTEPQAKIQIFERKIGNKKYKQRVISTDLNELKKVIDKSKPTQSLREVFRSLNKAILKDKKDV